jgi:hypothetical protein
MRRRRLAPIAFTLAALASWAGDAGFTGEWTLRLCRDGVEDCGNYTVHLFQRGNRLCGRHEFATLGLSELDESAGLSVRGRANGNVALIELTSGRDASVSQHRLRRHGKTLQWDFIKWLTPLPHDGLIPPTRLEWTPRHSAWQDSVVAECTIELAP